MILLYWAVGRTWRCVVLAGCSSTNRHTGGFWQPVDHQRLCHAVRPEHHDQLCPGQLFISDQHLWIVSVSSLIQSDIVTVVEQRAWNMLQNLNVKSDFSVLMLHNATCSVSVWWFEVTNRLRSWFVVCFRCTTCPRMSRKTTSSTSRSVLSLQLTQAF